MVDGAEITKEDGTMDIRMMAFDMDGTLRTSAGFPERNCRALQECEKRGIKLVFCSGREVERLREFAKIVGVDPWLASYNGSRIDRPSGGEMVQYIKYREEDARRVYRVTKATGLPTMVFTAGKMYCTNLNARGSDGKLLRMYEPGVIQLAGQPWEVVNDDTRLEAEALTGASKFVVGGVKFDPNFKVIAEALADMNLAISASSHSNIEIMCSGVNKGAALRRIAEIEQIAPENIMAFGDHTNDLPMLNYVGWPVAMENGSDEAKAAAKWVAPLAAESGVAQIIEQYVLGG